MVLLTLPAVWLGRVANGLIALAPFDMAIIAIYFAMLLGIGVYLRRYADTSNDFFMAGCDMTAEVCFGAIKLITCIPVYGLESSC